MATCTGVSKRQFIGQAGKYAAAGMTGAMILEQLQPNYAWAQQVAPDDPDIGTSTVEYDSPEGHGKIRGLMARPARAPDALPAVLVVHENRGLISKTLCVGLPKKAISLLVPTV